MNLFRRQLNVFGKVNLKLGSFNLRTLSVQKNRFHMNFDMNSLTLQTPLKTKKAIFPKTLQVEQNAKLPLELDDSFFAGDEEKIKEYELNALVSSMTTLMNGEGQEETIEKSLDHLVDILDGSGVIQSELGRRQVCELISHYTFGYAIQLQVGTKEITPLTMTLIHKGLSVLNYLCNHNNTPSGINHVNIEKLHECQAVSGITAILKNDLFLRNKDIVFASLHFIKSLHTSFPETKIVEAQTLRSVVRILENHGIDPKILVFTLDVLCVVIDNDNSGQANAELQIGGLTRPLMDLITFHKDNKNVIQSAVRLLHKYGENQRGIQDRLIENSGADKILMLLDIYQNDAKLTCELARTLSALFCNSPESRIELGDMGVCSVLVDLYDNMEEDEDKSVIMDVMRDISLDNAQNEKRFKKLGVDVVDDGY